MDQMYSLSAPNSLLATRETHVSVVDALPADPARVNPLHLPALAHIAADLEQITAPVRVVPAATSPCDELGVCVECSSGPSGDVPVWDAVATVRAYDSYGNEEADEVCVMHLHLVVAYRQRREWLVTVDVPAGEGRRWLERTARETFYAASRHFETGVAVVRGMFDAWRIVDVDSGFVSSRALCAVGLRDGESDADARARAEMLAQAVASVRAAEAYEAAQTAAETLPAAAAVTGVAA